MLKAKKIHKNLSYRQNVMPDIRKILVPNQQQEKQFINKKNDIFETILKWADESASS